MEKILVICGQTGVGKTSLALTLAKKYQGEILSADSRQVYKDLDIGTGKDLPKSAQYKKGFWGSLGYYLADGIRIWGYDLASPNKPFSVSDYLKNAEKIASGIHKRDHLLILVGGTGFYIKGFIDGINTADIPKNNKLRKSLVNKTIEELYDILARTDPIRAGGLNSSDRKNPRRLIRAIEVALWKTQVKNKQKQPKLRKYKDVLFVGLLAPKEKLKERIDKRIKERIDRGIIEEIRALVKKKISWGSQAMESIGYKEFKDYFKGNATLDQVIGKWKVDEMHYTKRQLTWFKKDKRITWFDISESKWKKDVEELVKKWYDSNNSNR